MWSRRAALALHKASGVLLRTPWEPALQGKLWQKLQNATLRKKNLKSWNFCVSLATHNRILHEKPHQTAPRHPPRLSPPLSPLLFVSASVQTISPCMLHEYLSVLSPSVYKSPISKDLFLQFEPVLFFLFLLELPILCFVTAKVLQSQRNPPHPYQWLPFIWCHWKCMHFLLGRMGGKKKNKDGETKTGESIELKWNYFSWGRKTLCSLRYWIALEGGRTRAHMLGLYQRILNSYINYLGNIAEDRKKNRWSCLHWIMFAKSWALFMTQMIYLLNLVCLFPVDWSSADGGFTLSNLTSLISEEYCTPPRCTEFICFLRQSLLFPHDNWSCFLI